MNDEDRGIIGLLCLLILGGVGLVSFAYVSGVQDGRIYGYEQKLHEEYIQESACAVVNDVVICKTHRMN